MLLSLEQDTKNRWLVEGQTELTCTYLQNSLQHGEDVTKGEFLKA